jgi:lysophospholipase L1-like esterase
MIERTAGITGRAGEHLPAAQSMPPATSAQVRLHSGNEQLRNDSAQNTAANEVTAAAQPSKPARINIVCLGDSNSDESFIPEVNTWCRRIQDAKVGDQRVRLRNYAIEGSTICRHPHIPEKWAMTQLSHALEDGKLGVVVAAFGTNDIVWFDKSPDEIVAAYVALDNRIKAAGGRLLVALTPPLMCAADDHPEARLVPNPDFRERVAAVNAALRRRFRPEQLIDFHSRMGKADNYVDGGHLSNDGQRLRAERVLGRLRSQVLSS